MLLVFEADYTSSFYWHANCWGLNWAAGARPRPLWLQSAWQFQENGNMWHDPGDISLHGEPMRQLISQLMNQHDAYFVINVVLPSIACLCWSQNVCKHDMQVLGRIFRNYCCPSIPRIACLCWSQDICKHDMQVFELSNLGLERSALRHPNTCDLTRNGNNLSSLMETVVHY